MSTKRNTIRGLILTTIVGILSALIVGVPTPAFADAHAEVHAVVIDEASLNAAINAASASSALLDSNGNLNLRYQKAAPKHYDVNKALHTPFAKGNGSKGSAYVAGVKSGKPFRLHKGEYFPDTGIDANGHPRGYTNFVGSKNAVGTWILFQPDKYGKYHRRGFYNGHKWTGDCWNVKPPVVTTTTAHVNLSQYLTWVLKLAVSLTGHGSAEVTVTCQGSSANVNVGTTSSVTGSVLAKILATTKSNAESKSGSVSVQESIKSTLRESLRAQLKIDIQAEATCTDTGTPTFTAPVVSANPGTCVNQGGTTGIATIGMVNNNTTATPADVTMTAQSTQHVPNVVANGGSASVTFTGLAPGTTYSGTVTFTAFGVSAPYSVTIKQCDTPTAPAPDVTLNTFNQVIQTKAGHTGLSVQMHGGNDGTVTVSTLYGQITSTKTFTNVTGLWSTTIDYLAPGEQPDGTQSFSNTPAPPVNYDQVRVVVTDNQTGKQVVTYTNVKITAPIPAP